MVAVELAEQSVRLLTVKKLDRCSVSNICH